MQLGPPLGLITFSIAGKMGVYKNTTYFSDDVDDFLPIGFIRKSSNTINLITKKIWYNITKKIWYNVEKKSNRVEIVGFKAFRFCFKAFRFRFGAIRFDFGAIRFCFDGLSINFLRLERLLFVLTASGL